MRYNNLKCIKIRCRDALHVSYKRSVSLKTVAAPRWNENLQIRGENFPHLYHRCASMKSRLQYRDRAKTNGNDWKNMGMIWLSVSILRKPLNAFGSLLFLSWYVSRVFRYIFMLTILCKFLLKGLVMSCIIGCTIHWIDISSLFFPSNLFERVICMKYLIFLLK